MIAKLKVLFDPILQKVRTLRKTHGEDQDAETSFDDEQTLPIDHPVKSTELATSSTLAQEEEVTEETLQKPSYIAKATSWLKPLLKRWKNKQQATDPENTDIDPTLDIQHAETVDVHLDTEGEDQVDENSPGKFTSLTNTVLGWVRRKIVWIPALTLFLLGIGTALTLLITNKMSAQEEALHYLQIQAKKLEQENQVLKNSRGKTIVTKAQPPVVVLPLPAVSRSTNETTMKENSHGGDCLLSDKTNVRESLKSCIEAFNASSN